MKYSSSRREIDMTGKVINELDKFVLDFVTILEKHAKYVLVSGYVSILFGRTRGTEDVDLLVESLDFAKFVLIFDDLINEGFECLNTSDKKEAFEMLGSYAIRFSKGEIPIPNMEFKMIKDDIQRRALKDRLRVIIGEDSLFLSPLELQISYKLSLMAKGSIEELSSDKDFEDAKHIYEMFKEEIDLEKLKYFVNLFNVNDKLELLKNGI